MRRACAVLGGLARRDAFWNVACRNGHSFAILIYGDANGSTKVLACAMMKVIKTPCFVKF